MSVRTCQSNRGDHTATHSGVSEFQSYNPGTLAGEVSRRTDCTTDALPPPDPQASGNGGLTYNNDDGGDEEMGLWVEVPTTIRTTTKITGNESPRTRCSLRSSNSSEDVGTGLGDTGSCIGAQERKKSEAALCLVKTPGRVVNCRSRSDKSTNRHTAAASRRKSV
ncbi:hypothetical protein BJX68DRAFT_245685 [Aspergillus pseudodeflectus]|uniref:Uncharacterized protein n=1 Tax=Aspergillus pseudodeflectus TaxID=176178 RepID=A0ABR4JMU6_9EURO